MKSSLPSINLNNITPAGRQGGANLSDNAWLRETDEVRIRVSIRPDWG